MKGCISILVWVKLYCIGLILRVKIFFNFYHFFVALYTNWIFKNEGKGKSVMKYHKDSLYYLSLGSTSCKVKELKQLVKQSSNHLQESNWPLSNLCYLSTLIQLQLYLVKNKMQGCTTGLPWRKERLPSIFCFNFSFTQSCTIVCNYLPFLA